MSPNGYSAVGGQTLNPYGRKKFDTGGSSSGSGSAVAANYATVAVGTETSGSILSPSSSNSIVGLKPTVGLLSRDGIIPISSTLDTPGPMTKSTKDNAILLSAMVGFDPNDEASSKEQGGNNYVESLSNYSLEGKRFGVIASFLTDSLYAQSAEAIKSLGGEMITIAPEPTPLNGFLSLLNLDMKKDLPAYLKRHASDSIKMRDIPEIIDYNNMDTLVRIPYGQGRFEGIISDTVSKTGLELIKEELNNVGSTYFSKPMDEYSLDAILSINNWNAGQAAVAKYPCLTVPMGYDSLGTPMGITFIAKPYEELMLLQIGHQFEKHTKARIGLDTFN